MNGLNELDWETGLKEEADWTFWRSCCRDFWASGWARMELRSSLYPGAFRGPKKSMYDFFSFAFCLKLQEEGWKRSRKSNERRKESCNSRKSEKERESKSSKTRRIIGYYERKWLFQKDSQSLSLNHQLFLFFLGFHHMNCLLWLQPQQNKVFVLWQD